MNDRQIVAFVVFHDRFYIKLPSTAKQVFTLLAKLARGIGILVTAPKSVSGHKYKQFSYIYIY